MVMNMRSMLSVLFFVLFAAQLAVAGEVDNSLYARVLTRHLSNGLVDYEGLEADRTPLDEYLVMMGQIDPESLSRNDRLAFYLNLYNAATLKLIIDNYPVDSIKDIGSFFSSPWKKKVVMLNGELVTLDNIEHDIVRPYFKEPRVHFALNCTALSCPPLLDVPYEGDLLEEQLQSATVSYINDGVNNYLDGKTLYVSKIFDWFSEDFPDDFTGWFAQFAQGELKQNLEKTRKNGVKLRIKYLKYDWSLNRLP